MQAKLITLNGRENILKFWRINIQWIRRSFKLLRMKLCKREKKLEKIEQKISRISIIRS